jgi:hypothetical protein
VEFAVAVGGVRAAGAVQVIVDAGAVGKWPVLEPRNFSRGFDRRILKAQVPRITVHGTRETCGSLLAACYVHPRVAMQILRHSKIAVTMEIHTEVPPAATREALRTLGQWLAAKTVAVLFCCTGIKNGQLHDRNWPLS